MKKIITFDVGGTNIRAALFHDYDIKAVEIIKTNTVDEKFSPFQKIVIMAKELWPIDGEIEGVAVAAPGFIDFHTGIVISAANVPGWRDLPLKENLEKELNVPVVVNNDARMAAYGEWKCGAGRGFSHMIYLTVSTGIGGGVIIENQLLNGARGLSTELGHLTLDPDGPICSCGQKGHLEAFASGQGIENYVMEKMTAGMHSSLNLTEKISTKIIAQAASNGDALSLEAFEVAGYYLGLGCAGLVHTFNPSALIIGGGVSFSGDLLFKPFERSLQKHVMDPEYLKNMVIKPAQLGDNAGLIGTMLYLQECLQKHR